MITDYESLQNEVADWLQRTDVKEAREGGLTAAVKTFIQMAEVKFRRDHRCRKLQDRGTFSISADGAALPSDFMALQSWYHDDGTNYGRIDIVDAESLGALKAMHGATGVPRWAAIIDGATVRFAPAPATTYATKMLYWRKITPLSDSNTTNWLLQDQPDIYLYGALIEAAPYLKDDPQLKTWADALEARLNELQAYTERQVHPAGEAATVSPRVDGTRTLNLASYAGLQRAVSDWLDRADLSAVVPVFIDTAERSLARDRRLRRLATSTVTINGDDVALPADFLAVEALYYDGAASQFGSIEIVGADRLAQVKATLGVGGVPRFASVINGTLRFAPAPDVEYTAKLVYWEKLDGVSAGNWLFTSHPDVYLYAALVEAAPYLGQDARVAVWRAELERRITEVAALTDWAQHPSGALGGEGAAGVRSDGTRSLSVSTYAGLQKVVADWLDRADLSAAVPLFITQAERKFSRDRRLRHMATDTVTITGDPLTLPTDFQAVEAWYLNGDDGMFGAIDIVAPDRIGQLKALHGSGGVPRFAAIINGTARFAPAPDVQYETQLIYWEKLDPVANGANWLFTEHPDVYVYGALLEAAPYLGQDARLEVWRTELESRIAEIEAATEAAQYPHGRPEPGTSASARADGTRTLALGTYADLLKVVADWLDRADITAAIPVMITLAEKRLASDPRLRKLAFATFSITEDDLAMPADFRAVESWYHDGGTYYGPIEIVGGDAIGTLKARFGAAGVPRVAAVVEGIARFAPAPDQTYSTKLVYWRTLTPLSSGVNWLYQEHPHIYLYATLREAEPYLGKDPRIMLWQTRLDDAIEAVRLDDWNAQFGGSVARLPAPIGG